MTTRPRAFPTFLFAGSDAYCKRFQALLSILLTLLPAIPQLHVRVGAVGKFTHEKYGRPPRVIRFRCFVRFAGSLPPRARAPFSPCLPPFSFHPPPALVSPGCLSISIPYTVRSLFIYRFNEHVRDKASRNIDIGWSIPARLARSLVWRVLHLSLGKTKDRPIAISPGVSGETRIRFPPVIEITTTVGGIIERFRDLSNKRETFNVRKIVRIHIFFIEGVGRRVWGGGGREEKIRDARGISLGAS